MPNAKELKTISDKSIVVKEYITARERNVIRDASAKFLDETGKSLDPAQLSAYEKLIIELVVVSYEGSSENVYERTLDLDPKEYDDIVAKANKVMTGFLAPGK